MVVSALSEIQYDIKEEKKKVIPALRKMASACTGCGICLNNCVFHKYSKKTSKIIMKNIKEFVLSKKLDKKLYKITKKYIWSCGLCEHCNNSCPLPEKIPKTAFIILLRGILNVKNEAPFIIKLLRRTIFKDNNNPILKFLFPIVAKILVPGWYSSKDPMLIKERKVITKARTFPKKGAEICFSSGCGHTWSAPNVVFGVTTILEQASIDFITIGNTDFCCGVAYGVLGFLDLWINQAYNVVKNYLSLNPRPKTILLHCPGCFISYSFDLSKWGLTLPFNLFKKLSEPIEIKHIVEYILQLIKENKIQFKHKIPLTVTYNDNCSVGRRAGLIGEALYDAPREIIRNIPGLKLVESDYIKDDAFCCGLLATKPLGFGTNLKGIIGKDSAYKNQRKLFENIIKKGSSNLVVPCMGCIIGFEDSARVWASKLGKKVNIWDLNELVNLSMGINIPKRHMFINDTFKLSLPFFKKDSIKLLSNMIKTQAFRNIFKFLKETISYIRKR